METINITGTGTSAWAGAGMSGFVTSPMAPIAQLQGSALSFAPAYPVGTVGMVVAGARTAAHSTDDGKVPDPRGPQR